MMFLGPTWRVELLTVERGTWSRSRKPAGAIFQHPSPDRATARAARFDEKKRKHVVLK